MNFDFLDINKKNVLSGIQPTGTFTLGNYIGAIRRWVDYQNKFNSFFMIADLHSLTVRSDPHIFKKRAIESLAMVIACGIDPEKSIIFFQSHVPAHSQLAWLLTCYGQFGELNRMIQFKEKSFNNENVNCGIFTYPILQAADILLYNTSFVPVGSDQTQHIELARNIAQRFNNLYNFDFTLPIPDVSNKSSRIMSLIDPMRKMSKTDPNTNSCIFMLDSPDEISNKIKRATTDSESTIAYAVGRDAINNLLTIYSALSGMTFDQIAQNFQNQGYGELKRQLTDIIVSSLKPIQQQFLYLMKNQSYLKQIYNKGAKLANMVANHTLSRVHSALAFDYDKLV